jgi:hypothetical protein
MIEKKEMTFEEMVEFVIARKMLSFSHYKGGKRNSEQLKRITGLRSMLRMYLDVTQLGWPYRKGHRRFSATGKVEWTAAGKGEIVTPAKRKVK